MLRSWDPNADQAHASVITAKMPSPLSWMGKTLPNANIVFARLRTWNTYVL